MSSLTHEKIWSLLEQITDPEIPAISLVDLGVIRSVGVDGQNVSVVMTPTFAGCPALAVMREVIRTRLLAEGAGEVNVHLALAPPWSTNWITTQGRERLRDFGLAPPPKHDGDIEAALQAPAVCPNCASADTILKNDFGPTLCRSLYVCRACRQPFEQFKPL